MATAAVIPQTRTFSGTPDYTAPLTFTQFNPAWGTLQSIDIIGSIGISGGALRLDNDAVNPASGAVFMGSYLNVSSTDVLIYDASLQPIFGLNEVLAQDSGVLGLDSDDGDAEVGGTANYSTSGDDWNEWYPNAQSDSESGTIGATVWESLVGYIGTGTFSISALANQLANYGSLGGVQAQIDPISTSGEVQIIYTYEPIPEPAEWAALFGFSVVLISLLRRRA